MKKYLIVSVWVLSLFAFSGIAYGAVKSTFARLPEGSTSYVYGDAIDKEHMTIVKFIDGKITCYSAITKVGANQVNASISCVK